MTATPRSVASVTQERGAPCGAGLQASRQRMLPKVGDAAAPVPAHGGLNPSAGRRPLAQEARMAAGDLAYRNAGRRIGSVLDRPPGEAGETFRWPKGRRGRSQTAAGRQARSRACSTSRASRGLSQRGTLAKALGRAQAS